jgi:serine/threonine protein phosphatase 1
MRTLVTADIHGGYRALKQCLERCGFDYKKDRLIQLGDVCDGWPETKECFEGLLKIDNRIDIIGNHCFWLLKWILYGDKPYIWTSQGGQATIDSYGNPFNIPESHINLLKNACPYYVTDNKLFVHGGYIPEKNLSETGQHTLMWDRDLAFCVCQGWIDERIKFDEVYIGHTTTESYTSRDGMPITKPIHSDKIWLMDTGAGWSGKLTIMDIETKEYWQSDFVKDLYPEEKGR